MPEVSIIVSVYNKAKYLEACLESILNQSYQNIEAICVNDGSTDNSLEILKRYAEKDSRISVIEQDNRGCAGARNTGFAHAKGKYCCFIDADDCIDSDFVQFLLTNLHKYNADIASCNIIKYGAKRKNKNSTVKLLTKPLETMLSKKNFRIRFSVGPRLYKRELIEDLKFLEGNSIEDYPWSVVLMGKKPRVAVSNSYLYHYTYVPDSVSKSVMTTKKIQDYWQGLEYVYHNFSGQKKNMSFLKNRLIPNILKSQLQLISAEKQRDDLFAAFARELKWVKENNLFSLRHHNWFRLYKYWKIMSMKARTNDAV